MNNKSRKVTFFISIVILMFMFSTNSFTQIQKQALKHDDCTITGVISDVTENTLELADGAIKIDTSKSYTSGKKLSPEGNGKYIFVTGSVSPTLMVTGTYVNSIADLNDQPVSNYFQPKVVSISSHYQQGTLLGQIQEINLSARTIKILDQEILIDEKAFIQTLENQNVAQDLSILKVNKFISANLILKDNEPRPIAISITQSNMTNPRKHISGPILEVNDNNIKVLGNNLNIPLTNTKIRSFVSCETIAPSLLKPGMLVSIYFDPNNQKIDTISVRLSNEGIIEGTIKEINLQNKMISIGHQEVFFNDETTIVPDKNDSQMKDFSFENLNPSEKLNIIYKAKDGKLIASYIEPIANTLTYTNDPCCHCNPY